jgi:RNA polymerase sigma factor (sigma-70 family)
MPTDFENFTTHHSPILLRQALGLANGDWHTAEDFVQTALLRISSHWEEISQPKAYAKRVLWSVACDWYRSNRLGTVHLCESDREFDQLAPVEKKSAEAFNQWEDPRSAALEQALSALTRRQRTVILLRYWYGFTEADIAATLNIASGTVKSVSSRARETIRGFMLRSNEEGLDSSGMAFSKKLAA